MPNHIKNKLELIGSMEDVDSMIKRFSTYVPAKINMTHDNDLAICKSAKKDDWAFCWMDLKTGEVHDRGSLKQYGIPQGFELEIKDSVLCFPDFEKVIPPPDDPAYKDLPSQKIAETSPNWWYTWNIKNWGNKWGGYGYERQAINQFTFDTAWLPSPKIIEVISRAFPSVTIKYSWADEDTGHHCGRSVYHNGLLESHIPEGGSKEAYELAFELRPDYAKDYQLINGKYVYTES